MPRVIVLDGPVGVGKTTLLNELKKHLSNSYIIPEYIDALDDGETMLRNYLEGSLSAYEFQSYILDYFESVANQLHDSSYDFIFVERSPVEGIITFAKLALDNHKLTQAQYNTLLQRAQSITFFPNPLHDIGISISTDYMTLNELIELITTVLFDTNIIKLRASLPTLKNRIQRRGRPCELEHYSDEFINTIIELYK